MLIQLRLIFCGSVLGMIYDIEELRVIVTGWRVALYGTREALPLAQVVTMPYSMLLHKRTRESVGIRVKGNVVVLDEAHNVIDAINQMHSSTLALGHVLRAQHQLQQYERRYRTRLGDQNLLYIKQILFILKSLAKFLGNFKSHAFSCAATTSLPDSLSSSSSTSATGVSTPSGASIASDATTGSHSSVSEHRDLDQRFPF